MDVSNVYHMPTSSAVASNNKNESNGNSFASILSATQQAEAIAKSSGSSEPSDIAEKTSKPDPVAEFLAYMNKTQEERYFDAFLKSQGMTQEEFEALPSEEKMALMAEYEEVRAEIAKAIGEKDVANSTA